MYRPVAPHNSDLNLQPFCSPPSPLLRKAARQQPGGKAIITTAMLAALGMPVSAATNFTGGLVGDAANWDNGAPTTAGNTGIITINGEVGNTTALAAQTSVVGYFIDHQGGTVSATSFQGSEISNTTWNVNGGTLGTQGINLVNGSVVSLNTGAINTASGRDLLISGGSSLTINGGTATIGDDLATGVGNGTIVVNAGTVTASDIQVLRDSSLTIHGGTVSSSGAFGSSGFQSGTSEMFFNAGTISGARLVFQSTELTLGGSTAGSATYANWGLGNYTNSDDRQRDSQISINFLSGTLMSLTLENTARALDLTNNSTNDPTTDAWAKALWDNDQLLYNGSSSTDLGLSWADATNSNVGLGGGEYFAFAAAGTFGGTLSLVVPEPASLALLGLGGMLILGRRRWA